MSIQLKRSLKSNIDPNFLLKDGQVGIEKPSSTFDAANVPKLKVGDGTTVYSNLPYITDGIVEGCWTNAASLGILPDGTDIGPKLASLSSDIAGLAFPAGTYKLRYTYTFNIPVYFAPGAMFESSAGFSAPIEALVQFNKPVIAGRYRIFGYQHPDDAIYRLNANSIVYPEWFGWQSNGTDFTHLNYMFSSIVSGSTLLFGIGNYVSTNSSVPLPGRIRFVGESKYSTNLKLNWTISTTTVEEFELSNATLGSGTQFTFKALNALKFKGIYSPNSSGQLLTATSGQNIYINDCIMRYNESTNYYAIIDILSDDMVINIDNCDIQNLAGDTSIRFLRIGTNFASLNVSNTKFVGQLFVLTKGDGLQNYRVASYYNCQFTVMRIDEAWDFVGYYPQRDYVNCKFITSGMCSRGSFVGCTILCTSESSNGFGDGLAHFVNCWIYNPSTAAQTIKLTGKYLACGFTHGSNITLTAGPSRDYKISMCTNDFPASS